MSKIREWKKCIRINTAIPITILIVLLKTGSQLVPSEARALDGFPRPITRGIVMHTGILQKLPTKRYGFHDEGTIFELTSGDVVEIEIAGTWKTTRIEFDNSKKEYCSTDGYALEGALARVSY